MKILYLDQSVYSNFIKGADPLLAPIEKLIHRLIECEKLIVPFSDTHMSETNQWHLYNSSNSRNRVLRGFFSLARGKQFKSRINIEDAQILRSWHRHQSGKAASRDIEWRDAFNTNPSTPSSGGNAYLIRQRLSPESQLSLKSRNLAELEALLETWRNIPFDEHEAISIEMSAAAEAYETTWTDYENRLRSGDPDAYVDSTAMLSRIEWMLCGPPHRVEPCRQKEVLRHFLRSEHFSNTPHIWLEVRMFVTLRKLVYEGAFSNKESFLKGLKGIFEDIEHVSKYSPYCDAIFVDKFVAEMLGRSTISMEQHFGTRVFSRSNLAKFQGWLNEIE